MAQALTVTILVVEDEPLVRLVTVDELRDAGFDVLEAENATAALAILRSGVAVELVFTDVNVPGALDGLQFARLVRAIWPGVRLVVTSGRGKVGPEDVPADSQFLAKPYSLERLTALLADLVGGRPA